MKFSAALLLVLVLIAAPIVSRNIQATPQLAGFSDFLTTSHDGWFDSVTDTFEDAADTVQDGVKSGVDHVSKAAGRVKDEAERAAGRAKSAAERGFHKAVDTVKKVDEISDQVNKKVTGEIWKHVPKPLQTVATGAFNVAGKVATSTVGAATEQVIKVIPGDKNKELFQTAVNGAVKGAIEGALSGNLKGVLKGAVKGGAKAVLLKKGEETVEDLVEKYEEHQAKDKKHQAQKKISHKPSAHKERSKNL